MSDSDEQQSEQFCDRCGKPVVPGAGNWWQVRIDAVVDPTPPEITAEDLRRDTKAALADTVAELQSSDATERELMDEVHRKLTLQLCATCFRRWIEDPTP